MFYYRRCYFPSCRFFTWISCYFCCYCCIHARNTCCPTIIGCCIYVTTHLLPNIQVFSFALASLCFGVVLPKFKLLERGTWASTLIAIYLCNLSLASFTFVGDQTLLMIILSHLSTCFWILMIFAFTIIIVHGVVMASLSYFLISLFLSTTFCIVFWCKMPKYWSNVMTWDLE